jgi:long-chain acyl-CoA synthetase
MYASVRRYEVADQDTAQELVRRGYEGLRPILAARAGFVAYELIVGESSFASISVFETWVTAEESNAVAAIWVRQNIPEFELEEPQITAGPVYEHPGAERAPFSAPEPVRSPGRPREADARMGVGANMVRAGAGGDLGWPLQRAARLHSSSEAFVDGARTITYGELANRIGSLGAALDDLGVPAGGRVGFLGVNSLAHVECVMGVPAFGRVLVDLNFRLAEAELAFMVDDCGTEVLVVDRDQLDVARSLHARCENLRVLVFDGTGPAPEGCLLYEELVDRDPIEPPTVDEHSLAAISYTGGTTGAPKGVMLSHANLLANARHNLIATGHSSQDRWLHVCPMFHVAGTANVFACTWVGAKQVILPRFAAEVVAETMRRESITHCALVPTMLAMLVEALDGSPAQGLPSLQHIQYAASPISAELQRQALERLECDVAQFYGMTEAAPTVTHLPPDDHRRGVRGDAPHAGRLRSIGTPVVGVETDVRDLDGAPLPAGEIGELWVRGPNVMLGYWNRAEATESALVDGWYRTGDAARADDDGYLYLVDRLKDMIITGGENVYSMEVEMALLEHEAVREAAVFGIPHPRWGEAVHAVVAVTAGSAVTVDQLIEHCRQRIAGYKIPRTTEIRTDALPKSGAGKLLKNPLREPYWADHDRRVN